MLILGIVLFELVCLLEVNIASPETPEWSAITAP